MFEGVHISAKPDCELRVSAGVSIVGYACRLPGAANAEEFWRLLSEERTSVCKVPSSRFATNRYLHPNRSVAGKSVNFSAGMLDDIYGFDAGFFGMSPREAIQTDPQQRLLLQVVWECLEQASIPPSSLAGKSVGVFVGAASWDYLFNFVFDPLSMDAQTMTGNTLSIVANRVSYILDLKGPSFTVDTACSSSLVALNQACEAISSGRIDTAIVAGVHLLASPFPFAGFSRAFMLSGKGRCSAFDAEGDGYVRGEGAAAFLLQSKTLARRDQRTIHANIVGWGTNQDGRTVGLSMPSTESQSALLRDVYRRFDLDPTKLAFIEAHGTGTRVGDPAEANAIGRSLAMLRDVPLPIGSVKTNIGHLEPASGAAGLLKALLSLKHGVLPASLHFKTPNPDIAFSDLNLEVVTTARQLDTEKFTLAGVNSFGFGGSNAHVVLEKADEASPRRSKPPAPIPLVLSARSPEALRALAGRYVDAIRTSPEPFSSFCSEAAYGRDHLEHRAVILPAATSEMLACLDSMAAGQSPKGAVVGKAKIRPTKIAFAFSGNGSQWPGMGLAAYRQNAVFRETLQQVDALFSELADWSLVEALHSADLSERLKTASVAQALLFAIQVGLVNALKAFGIEPCVIVGHSAGEIAAAWAAGALDLDQALKVIHSRSTCQETGRGKGGMAAVVMTRDQAESLFSLADYAGLEIAAVNAARSLTITGAHKELDLFTKHARQKRWPLRRIEVDYAYHSHFADPVQKELIASLRDLSCKPSKVPFVSSVYGRVIEGSRLDANYWWKNVRHTVDFLSAMEVALDYSPDLVLEIGPSPVLTGYIADIAKQAGIAVATLPTLERKEAENVDPLFTIAASAFVNGAHVSPERMFGPRVNTGLDLPSYPWQNVEYRVQLTSEAFTALSDLVHPLLGTPPRKDALTYFSHLDLEAFPWLKDHQVEGAVVFPGTAILETALAAAREVLGDGPLELRNCAIFKPMVLEAGVIRETMTRVSGEEGLIDLFSRPRGSSEDWIHHARTRFGRPPPLNVHTVPLVLKPDAAISSEAVYQTVEKFGFQYGPAFRRLETLSILDACNSVAVLSPTTLDGNFLFDPTVVDAVLHGTLFTLFSNADVRQERRSYVPTRIDSLRLYQPGRPVRRCRITTTGGAGASASADLAFLADDDSVVAIAQGGQFSALRLGGHDERPHFYRVTPVPLATTGRSCLEIVAPQGMMSMMRELNLALDECPARGDVLLLTEEASRALAYESFRLVYGHSAFQPQLEACAESSGASDVLDRVLQDLAAFGMADQTDNGWVLASDPGLPTFSELVRTLLCCDPSRAPEALYLAYLGMALPEILRGAAPRAANASTLVSLDAASAFSLSASEALSKLVDVIGTRCANGDCVDVLLFNAADPALIRAVAAAIPPGRGSLTVSDLREERLSKVHDVERESNVRVVGWDRVSGEQRGKFDLVVAVNLIGQTSARDVALAKLNALLMENGAIVLIERAPNIFTEMLRLCAGSTDASLLNRPAELSQIFATAGFAAVEAKYLNSDATDAVVLVATKIGLPVIKDNDGKAQQSIVLLPGEQSELRSKLISSHTVSVGTASGLPCVVSSLENDESRAPVMMLATEPVDGDPTSWITVACETFRHALMSFEGLEGELWLVVRGAAPQDAAAVRPEAAALWGFARVASNEYPKVDLRLIDLSPELSCAEECARLRVELDIRRPEKEILISSSGTWGLRILQADHTVFASAASAGTSRLELEAPGSLDRLRWQITPRSILKPDQVELSVSATGLNFRDVMWALGLLPPDALEAGFAGATLGMECAGVVVRTGSEVRNLRPGDKCVAFAPAAFAQHIVVPEFAATKLPENIEPEIAAAIPVAFLTSYYSLKHLARLSPGETVLIHGGAGGVGLAAIQIAKWCGATPIATAGSPEKRALLKALGVEHVFHSRTLEFVDQVKDVTGGQGVDVVLNSLAGEAMERSIDCLKPFGRFIELGKRDFFADTRVGLRPFRKNLSYFGVDADQLLIDNRTLAQNLFAELLELFKHEELQPLPFRIFDGDEVKSAFRLMQQAGHVGKIVVRPAPGREFAVGAAPPLVLDPHETHVIVGGFGGFGIALAERLAERGARNLVLVGRAGAREPSAKTSIETLRSRGVRVTEALLDAANEDAMAELFASLAADMPPVTSIFHAAMVLDDGLIENLSPTRVAGVLRAKITVARVLDGLSEKLKLRWFVMFSSATTLVGNPGQASYVAANAYLEGLALQRRQKGLPALAIGWGAISDAGYLARTQQGGDLLAKRLAKYSLRVGEALDALELLLLSEAPTAAIAYSRFDWNAVGKHLRISSTPLLEFVRSAGTDQASEENATNMAEQLSSLSLEKSRERLVEILAGEIAKILRIPAAQIDRSKPLSDIGVDSLMGVELKLAAEETLGFEIPLMSIGGAGSMTDLAGRIAGQIHQRRDMTAASQIEELVYAHGGKSERPAEEVAAISAAIEAKEVEVKRVF